MNTAYSGIVLNPEEAQDSFFIAQQEEIGTIHASYHGLPRERKIKFLEMVEKWAQDELKKL